MVLCSDGEGIINQGPWGGSYLNAPLGPDPWSVKHWRQEAAERALGVRHLMVPAVWFLPHCWGFQERTRSAPRSAPACLSPTLNLRLLKPEDACSLVPRIRQMPILPSTGCQLEEEITNLQQNRDFLAKLSSTSSAAGMVVL